MINNMNSKIKSPNRIIVAEMGSIKSLLVMKSIESISNAISVESDVMILKLMARLQFRGIVLRGDLKS